MCTDSDEEDLKLRSLRAQGKSPTDKYDNREIGINSRLDTLQAAILLPKLKAFAEYELTAVNKIASLYTKYLKDKVLTPTIPDGFYSSWAQYTILLREKGIPSMIYYPRGIHQQKAYQLMHLSDKEYPNTIEATKRVLSLPMHPYLTNTEVEEVVRSILEVIK